MYKNALNKNLVCYFQINSKEKCFLPFHTGLLSSNFSMHHLMQMCALQAETKVEEKEKIGNALHRIRFSCDLTRLSGKCLVLLNKHQRNPRLHNS